MKKSELDEAIALTSTVLGLLTVGLNGVRAAALNYLCGIVIANGPMQLNVNDPAFWNGIATCFEAAPKAGATFDLVDAVRSYAEAFVPVAPAADAVRNLAIRMSLTEQARILAKTNFVSRQDVDRYFVRINASFDSAKTVAANDLDNVAYRLLISLHAAVSNDLANRARPLPRMVAYTFPQRFPALTLAQRIYYDPSRTSELIAENKPIHPLFMPPTGAALSA